MNRTSAQSSSRPVLVPAAPKRTRAGTAPIPSPLHRAAATLLRSIGEWFRERQVTGRPERLRAAETVSLGEKRFASVLHVDGRRFLVAGGASGVALLAELAASASPFSKALHQAAPRKRPTAKRPKATP